LKAKINYLNHIIELIVVIIGITIAFQLNNWKEEGEKKKTERLYLESLSRDLDSDIKNLNYLIDTTQHYEYLLKGLTRCLITKNYEHDSLFHFILGMYENFMFHPVSNTYESLHSSGGMAIIQDYKLKSKITELYYGDYELVLRTDQFRVNQFMDITYPYLSEKVNFGRYVIRDKAFLEENMFMNLAFSTYKSITLKIQHYQTALDNAQKLKKMIDQKIGSS